MKGVRMRPNQLLQPKSFRILCLTTRDLWKVPVLASTKTISTLPRVKKSGRGSWTKTRLCLVRQSPGVNRCSVPREMTRLGEDNFFKWSLSTKSTWRCPSWSWQGRCFVWQSSRLDAQSCPSKWFWQPSERILSNARQSSGTYSLICWPRHKDAKWGFYIDAQNGGGVSLELMN